MLTGEGGVELELKPLNIITVCVHNIFLCGDLARSVATCTLLFFVDWLRVYIINNPEVDN